MEGKGREREEMSACTSCFISALPNTLLVGGDVA